MKNAMTHRLLIFSLALAVMAMGAHGALAGHHEESKQDQDIVATAIAADDFNTLVAAVQAAGLVETLQGEGPYTVFAPTDEAFAKLPDGTVEGLLLEENRETLIAILTYHVVAGKVMAADVVELTSATTVEGSDLSITIEEDVVMVDQATVIMTDIETSNGVIHVIDTVLIPSE